MLYAEMPSPSPNSAETCAFYRRAVHLLRGAGIPFLVGGAYALQRYTGIVRHTKDFDIFTRPADARRVLGALAAAGYRTEMVFTHWLGKACCGDEFCDVIFSSGNGVCRVDDAWFEHAIPAEILGEPVRLIPAGPLIRWAIFGPNRNRTISP